MILFISQKEITPVGQIQSEQGLPSRFSALQFCLQKISCLLPSKQFQIPLFPIFFLTTAILILYHYLDLPFTSILQCCILFPFRLTTFLVFLYYQVSHFATGSSCSSTLLVSADLMWHVFLCALLNSSSVILIQLFHKRHFMKHRKLIQSRKIFFFFVLFSTCMHLFKTQCFSRSINEVH